MDRPTIEDYTEVRHKNWCKSLRTPLIQMQSIATGHTWVYSCDCGLDELLKDEEHNDG